MIRHRLRQVETALRHLASVVGCQQPMPPPRRLQTAQDVIDLLEEQVEAVRGDPRLSVGEKARLIGQLASAARRAIETGTLAARLVMLESVLQQRREKKP